MFGRGRRSPRTRPGRRRLRRLTVLAGATAGLAALRKRKLAENEARFFPRT